MMKTLKYYLIVNGLIIGVGSIAYCFFNVYVGILFKQLCCLLWFEWLSSWKPPLHPKRKNLRRTTKLKLLIKMIAFAALGDYMVIQYATLYYTAASSTSMNPLYFIMSSLIFELIFDLVHYWMHRIFHLHKKLYRLIHQTHHLQVHPSPFTTFDQSPIDLVFTNVIPAVIAIQCTPSMTELHWQYLFTYKIYVEIAGHSGLQLKGHSFPQFPWIDKILPQGFCLSIKDHDYHHTHPNCNFAKRFRVWDHLFGTFNS